MKVSLLAVKGYREREFWLQLECGLGVMRQTVELSKGIQFVVEGDWGQGS